MRYGFSYAAPALAGVLLAGMLAYGQETSANRVTVALSDPTRPVKLRVSVLNGSIEVRGYDGKAVTVETRGQGAEGRRHGRTPPKEAEGLHRIENASSGLTIEEENNTVSISGGVTRSADVLVNVPYGTSVSLRSTNGREIVADRIAGEIDINSTNSNVTIEDASGPVVAHTLNGRLKVTFDKVPPGKDMSFSTFNGDIDVTLPADTKANLKMKTDNGDIYTDFDVKLDSSAAKPTIEDNRKAGGKYRVRLDKGTYGSINGGGPLFQFTTFNGRIMIRKK